LIAAKVGLGGWPGRQQARCVRSFRAALVATRIFAAAPSKPSPGRLEAIEAQVRDEISVMQGVMICDLRQDEHPVRLDAPEVPRVIEVRISVLYPTSSEPVATHRIVKQF